MFLHIKKPEHPITWVEYDVLKILSLTITIYHKLIDLLLMKARKDVFVLQSITHTYTVMWSMNGPLTTLPVL